MQTEIEAKFLDVDHDVFRVTLRKLGGRRVHAARLMRRQNFDIPGVAGVWARVRDEGDRITLSYKQQQDRTLHGTKEICVTVDSFDNARLLMQAIGLQPTSYQETKRESWRMGDVQIELDQWPWSRPYVEIEGPSEAVVRETAGRLGFDWNSAKHGSVEAVYQAEYRISDAQFCAIPVIRFEDPMPKALAERKRS